MSELEEIVNKICLRIDVTADIMQTIKQAAYIVLNDYTIEKKKNDIVVYSQDKTNKAVQMFFITKKVEGRTDKTLAYYRIILNNYFKYIEVPIEETTADTIRFYLAKRSMQDKLSKVSLDNELRVLKSFFKFCTGDDYISKNPVANIQAVKKEKKIKKPFSETEIESMRRATVDVRELALLDVLCSTGCRISEIVGMNISDIDNDEMVVYGKGEKERYVYLNSKARYSLQEYLNQRSDDSDALFVTMRKPYKRISACTGEEIVRKIGKRAGVSKVHPHRFRRTCATMALNRGMPIQQVQEMLGHEDIKTTTIYARSEKDGVKESHRKFVT